MADIQLNNDLPANYRTPGVFTSLILGDPGAPAPSNRALLIGIMGSGGIATPNTPFLAVSSSDVSDQVKPWSPLAKMYSAFKSQLPSGVGAEPWLLPLQEPSGGTAATHLIKFLAPHTSAYALGSGTAALVSHTCTIKIAGRRYEFPISAGDTFATVASAAQAALAAVTDLEVVPTVNSETVTLTDRCKGLHGNDLSVSVEFSVPPSVGGVAASPGTIVFAAGPSGADGTAVVRFNIRRVSVAIPNTTTDAAAGTLLRDAINADSYPVTAAQAGSPTGTVTLYFRNDVNARGVHRILSTGTVLDTQTLTVTCGTLGAGVPSLTSALTTLAADPTAYRAIGSQFLDSTSWTSLVAHVEANARTPVEKGQNCYGAFTTVLPTQLSDSLAEQTTPKMTTSPRYRLVWAQGEPVRAWEICARACAMAVQAAVGQNLNGTAFVTNEEVPLPLPHRADRPTAAEIETAISTFRYAPAAVDANGALALIRSTTTFLALGDIQRKLEKWSCIEILDYFRSSLRIRLGALFGRSSVKAFGKPRTSRTVTPEGVKAAVFRLFTEWEAQDLYDGAEEMRDAIVAGVKVSPTRIDVSCPFRTVADLDQISIAGIQR